MTFISDEEIFALHRKLEMEKKKRYKATWKERHPDKLAEQKKRYKERHPDKLAEQKKRYNRRVRERRGNGELLTPFLGVDGEGAGEGASHIYWLLRVGEDALFHDDGSELQTLEILKWLADLGASGVSQNFIPVSFYFDYDTTMILRHLPEKNLRELMYDGNICVRRTCNHPKTGHIKGYARCAYDGCSCDKYLRGGETTVFINHSTDKYLRVKLQHRQFKVAWNGCHFFTVTDVADLFQSSFVKVLEKWQKVENESDLCTDDQLQEIQKNKARRSSFKIGFDKETFEYNALECKLLALLMSNFRNMCYQNGIFPDMWTGPGRLAEDIFKSERVPLRENLDIPPIIESLGDYAYYGGRMEGIHFGSHSDVVGYDIASAYPHAYTMMPCLLKNHGEWAEVPFEEVKEKDLQNTLVMGRIEIVLLPFWKQPIVCGLPMRDKRGSITFPAKAHGVWWWPEVRETLALYEKESAKHGYKYTVRIDKCFTWRQNCADRPGAFTAKWFEKRVQIGKSTRGIPIKLALNSLYGKAAQRVGAAKWANVVWAGLLTSITRARLLEATNRISPENIISYQTDGIFAKCDSLTEAVEADPKLGDWERVRYSELFLIQSGIYSAVEADTGKRTNKTRGMRDFEFSASYEDIVRSWEEEKWWGSFDLPPRNCFVTIKLGLMWNKPQLIGTWLHQQRKLSFTSNIRKREIWGADTKPTTDGRTFAPGPAHEKISKREYAPHPLNDVLVKSGMQALDGFSYPYNKEIAAKLTRDNKETETSYSYITPDEPYNLEG